MYMHLSPKQFAQVNFDQLVALSEAAHRRQQERESRRSVMLQQRIQEIKQEIVGKP